MVDSPVSDVDHTAVCIWKKAQLMKCLLKVMILFLRCLEKRKADQMVWMATSSHSHYVQVASFHPHDSFTHVP